MARAAELGQPGIGLTDHGNLFAAAQFFKACDDKKIKGVIGMEAYEAVPHQWDRERDIEIVKRKMGEGPRYFHLTLWAQNLQGWENLCALHAKSFSWNYKPRNQPLLDRALLEQHNEGLLLGLGCMASRTNVMLANEGEDAAYESAKFYVETFEDRVYSEVMGNLSEQQMLIHPQRRLATRLGVPVMAANDVHYLDREDGVENGPHHSLVQARAHRSKKQEAEASDDKSDAGYGKWYGSDGFYLKNRDEMLHTPGITAADLDVTLSVLDRVNFKFSDMPEPAPPIAPVPDAGEDLAFDAWLLTRT